MNSYRWRILCFGAVLDIIILDQLSKWAVTERILAPRNGEEGLGLLTWLAHAPERLPPLKIELLPFFNLVMVWNEGISFGLLSGANAAFLLIILSLLITGVFTLWLARSQNRMQGMSLALIIGGALGNVIDRLRFGAVIDFLDFHIAGLHWPAFNLADSCIVAGVALLIVYSLFFEKNDL